MNISKTDWLAKWHVTPGNGSIYGFLDGIRGIAILLVVASHTFYSNPNAQGLVKVMGSVLGAGTLGVTVFFTLSGFLIALPFWKRKHQGQDVMPPGYAMRRFWKIYPPLALSVLLLTPVYVMLRGDAMEYLETALQWLVGAAWLVPVSSRINPVMWSLVVEVHFYVLLPVCFICLRRVAYKTSLWTLSCGFLLVPVLMRHCYARYGIHWSLHPEIRVCFPVRLDAFALGILLAGLHASGTLRREWSILGPVGLALLPVTLCHGLIADMFPEGREWITQALSHYGAMLATAFMICFIGSPSSAARWGLHSAWLRLLGLISYEWYLFHQPVFFWSWRLLGLANGSAVKYVMIVSVSFFFSLGLAALVYRCFSLPILRWKRG